MITIKIGNIFESHMSVLVNTVNCVGVMGKGIAKDFKTKYPQMYTGYKSYCEQNKIVPGTLYPYFEDNIVKVINFPTKQHWRSPSKIEYIIDGLDWFVVHYQELNIASIAFPALGCGNGGLTWDVIGPLMYQKLSTLPIDIEIYAPFGTKTEKTTLDFLQQKASYTKNSGKVYGKINKQWLLALQIVKHLENAKYSVKVGRVVFQKICYILTRYGVDLNLHFTKGTYGPYSKDINEMITILSNNNLIEERQVGTLMLLTVTDSFKINKEDYTDQESNAVNRTYRLFKAIKSASEAEIVTAIIFAFDHLSQKHQIVTENMIYDYVHQWKTNYQNFQNEMYIRDFIKTLTYNHLINPDYTKDYKESVL